jgi:hypothetical protein
MLPSLKWLNHSLIRVTLIASSPEACWILWIFSTWVSPSFWQNLMQHHCSKCFVILNKMRIRRIRVTPLRYLAATDTSGGVARQQKVPSTTTLFPHPFAIAYRGKKYSWILFGQTVYSSFSFSSSSFLF